VSSAGRIDDDRMLVEAGHHTLDVVGVERIEVAMDQFFLGRHGSASPVEIAGLNLSDGTDDRPLSKSVRAAFAAIRLKLIRWRFICGCQRASAR
jgi:hypothetical protein